VAGALIHMKIAVMRRAITGPKANLVFSGGVIGALLAVGTIGVATIEAREQSTVMDLLAVVFVIWTLGWILGPAYGGQPVLRPEQFALQPVPRRKLALGLLGGAFVGVTTLVTLIAFTALIVFALGLGTVPVLVAVPAVLLQLTMVVLLSRLSARLFGALSRSRTGGAISSLLNAAMLVASSSGWIILVGLDAVLITGFSSDFSTTVRALPPSWGVLAVEASSRADWVMTALPLLGLVLLVVLLWIVYNRSLGPARWSRPTVRGSVEDRAAHSGWAASPAGIVFLKELRTWLRDPHRMQSLVLSPAFAVMTCLVPVAFDSTVFFPFVGALTALMGAVTSANLYGQDGTAMWLTLLMPGTEKADVRGRQLAWLSLYGPMTLVLTAVGIAVGGTPELTPWALAATFALLGGGAGLLPAIGLDQLAPGPDPRENKNSPLDQADVTGQSFVMLLMTLLTAAPAVGTVLAGHLLENDTLLWLGFPVGALTGWIAYLQGGRAGHDSLLTRGPELLYFMRTGKEQQTAAEEGTSVFKAMPKSRQRLLWTTFGVGCIALFPQALVPMTMKLSGQIAELWFLALYMPADWQWPVIILMFAIGLTSFGLAARICITELRARRS
jgi:hypothetical protein